MSYLKPLARYTYSSKEIYSAYVFGSIYEKTQCKAAMVCNDVPHSLCEHRLNVKVIWGTTI